MKYTVQDLIEDFPTDESCLEWLVEFLHPEGITCAKCQKVTAHRKVAGRQAYSCSQCSHQVYPMAGTIFRSSHIPLRNWFYAIYMMSTNKAGTPAVQIERELKVSYKTAWRMMHKIRHLMTAPVEQLSGEVEIDETYCHPNVYKRSSAYKKYGYIQGGRRTGQIIFGMVQRGGVAKVWHVKSAGERILTPIIRDHVKRGTLIHTDGARCYDKLDLWGYPHRTTNHSKLEFYREDSYTQNVENLWSTMKPRWRGTFKHISAKYLQLYANEFAWRYSHRNSVSIFWSLMSRLAEPLKPDYSEAEWYPYWM